MRKITSILVLLLWSTFTHTICAQENSVERRVKVLERQKNEITKQEKQALKEAVKSINERLEKGLISIVVYKTCDSVLSETKVM